jgi:hypothetical protein
MRPRQRFVAASIGLLLVSLLGTGVWVAGPASATPVRKPPKPIACQAMSSGATSPPVVSGCNRKGITGKSGTLTNCALGTCITWVTGKEIDFNASITVPTTSRCPSDLTEVDSVGKVISTSPGAGVKRLLGATVSFDACLSKQINVVTVELVPGTQFTIG